MPPHLYPLPPERTRSIRKGRFSWLISTLKQVKPSVISTTKLNTLRCLHTWPIKQVIYLRPYPLLRGMGNLILGPASHLDAFSVYPNQTWLPSDASGETTGTPYVCSPGSSRTTGNSPQVSMRPSRIETDLSHDGLNPARVPL